VSLERDPLILVSTIEELLGRKSSGFGLENLDYGRRGSVALTTRHYLSAKVIKQMHIFRRSVTLQNGDTKLSVAGVIRTSCRRIFSVVGILVSV
jgi:hypothetical protein